MKLSELKIGEPAQRALNKIGIITVEECSKYTKKELLALHGIGPKALRIIEAELKLIMLNNKK